MTARPLGPLLAALTLLAGPLAAEPDGYAPAPTPLPEAVRRMNPSSVPLDALRVRDGCWYYLDSTGDIRPWGFLGHSLRDPWCDETATPTPPG